MTNHSSAGAFGDAMGFSMGGEEKETRKKRNFRI